MRKNTRDTDPLAVFLNAESCAAVTGIPVRIIINARNAGCQAFTKRGAIYLCDLLKWLFSEQHADEQHIDWSEELKKWQARRAEIKAKQDAEEVVEVSDVAKSIMAVAGRIKPMLRQRLENEYPTFVAGLSAPEARVFGKRLNDAILVEFQKFADEFTYGHVADGVGDTGPEADSGLGSGVRGDAAGADAG